ncbi:protein phosphatase 2C domain-containing protein [bacterium]|nr:protein phosphatase 2C domain-containing protein [bacterium]
MLRFTEAALSQAGVKAHNQDFCASARTRTGAVFALADGISSSAVSAAAAEHAVNEFIAAMRRLNESMTARSAGLQALDAINERLRQESLAQGLSDDHNKGYVCTFTALVLKGRQAYLFHVGDTRLYRWREQRLECLTQDHRAWLDNGRSCLARALGAAESVSVDYRLLDLAVGDVFVLSSDGVHDHLDERDWTQALNDANDPTDRLLKLALARGSDDNLSLQWVRVDALDDGGIDWLESELARRPVAPDVDVGERLDGLTLLRAVHSSPRSRVFQAIDDASGTTVLLKLPSREGREDPAYRRRFLLEEWIGRQLDSPHIVRVALPQRPRRYLYSLLEWIDGQTLDCWRSAQATPSLDAVRDILEQAGRAIQAMHRRDLLHQDIKPDNLMIDANGHVTLIDFGSTRVAGLAEHHRDDEPALLGTALYTAPEYFLGEFGDERSDQFSLALLGYFLLSGEHPYGTAVAKARSARLQSRLRYRPLRDANSELPAWFDATLAKALSVQPQQRYAELSEFLYDLRHPNPNLKTDRRPLLERHPVRVWQGISALLAVLVLWQWWAS